MKSLKPDRYDIALIQEPYYDMNHKSRTNLCFTLVYPASHAVDPGKSHSLILVNTQLPSSSWSQIPIDSLDLTAIELRGTFGVIRVINIYNDCEHNDALDVLRTYLRELANVSRPEHPILYIWGGDFNCHHPMWDEIRNHHLFTRASMELVQPLLNMIAGFDMRMVLPEGIPTLKASVSGNYTRVDNVFCSAPLLCSFVLCDTVLGLRPANSDHMPVIYELSIEPVRVVHVPRPM
jgi:endonuclease/exonuclease/phosphatase family metal-dependent hydrolase